MILVARRDPARTPPCNPADGVIRAAVVRRTDEHGYFLGEGQLEDALVEATGLSWLRVTRGLDRMHIMRAYRYDDEGMEP